MIIRTEEEISHWAQMVLDFLNAEMGELTDADWIIVLATTIYSLGHRRGGEKEDEM